MGKERQRVAQCYRVGRVKTFIFSANEKKMKEEEEDGQEARAELRGGLLKY
jgi:hypothetical protein